VIRDDEEETDEAAVHRVSPLAYALENGLGPVDELLHVRELKHARRALDRVQGAQERRQGVRVLLVVLKEDDLVLRGHEVLAEFLQKQLQEFFLGNRHHSSLTLAYIFSAMRR